MYLEKAIRIIEEYSSERPSTDETQRSTFIKTEEIRIGKTGGFRRNTRCEIPFTGA